MSKVNEVQPPEESKSEAELKRPDKRHGLSQRDFNVFLKAMLHPAVMPEWDDDRHCAEYTAAVRDVVLALEREGAGADDREVRQEDTEPGPADRDFVAELAVLYRQTPDAQTFVLLARRVQAVFQGRADPTIALAFSHAFWNTPEPGLLERKRQA
ncbi:hypothetical protein Pla175_43780 [Pirellulimonas nuda]|uniref:Uncharacterized protein n=2 Tax=Pirellulimonas nuda TaxID=2528009 RepID=A0A518DHM2_9BACT|nr:hypothetical protein Pla175_43780 [Pirellulimonas nuda]